MILQKIEQYWLVVVSKTIGIGEQLFLIYLSIKPSLFSYGRIDDV